MIKVVIFDLDDTLYPERDYLKSGCLAIARYLASDDGALYEEYCGVFDALIGESHVGVFDRFCERYADKNFDKPKLLDVYRAHDPIITLFKDVEPCLKELKARGIKLALLTDGRSEGQRKKISALGLADLFDKIVVTSELGAGYEKPDERAYDSITEYFGVKPSEVVAVGDNPRKDFEIGKKGVHTVRVLRDGLYKDSEYLGERENYTVNSLYGLNYIVLSINEGRDETKLSDYFSSDIAFIRDRLLHIMDFVADVCDRENISYSLVGGTMIGAVRHKGFIPWDDDIDIVMPREDFRRFAAIIDGYCDGTEFVYRFERSRVPIVKYRTECENGGRIFRGIRVDIFIIDNLPDDLKKRKRLIFKLSLLQGMMHKDKIDWKRYNFKGKVLLAGSKFLGKFRTFKSLIKEYTKKSTIYDGSETKQRFISNDVHAMFSTPLDKEWFDGRENAVFEDREYSIYKQYDPLLTSQYGDYMSPPPEESRELYFHTRIED